MKTSLKRLLAAGFLSAAVLFGGGQGAAAQATGGAGDPAAVAYRKSVMQGLVAQVGSLRALLTLEVNRPGDIQRHTAAVVGNAITMHGLFPRNSTGETSGAMKEIWARPDEFRTRMQAFEEAARALDAAARSGDRALALAHLQIFTGTCGSCHAAFKLPPAFPPERRGEATVVN